MRGDHTVRMATNYSPSESPRPGGPEGLLRCGDLVLNPAGVQVRYCGRLVALRRSEFRLLAHFVTHPDKVFTRAELIRRLGTAEEPLDERTVDVWVGRLRRALRAAGVPDPLRTVRALGYVLDSPSA